MSVETLIKLHETARDINGNNVPDNVTDISTDNEKKRKLPTLIIPEPKKMSEVYRIDKTEKTSPQISPIVTPEIQPFPHQLPWQPTMYPGFQPHPYFPFRLPGFHFPPLPEFTFRPYPDHLNALLTHNAMLSSLPFPAGGLSPFHIGQTKTHTNSLENRNLDSEMNVMKSAFESFKGAAHSPIINTMRVSPSASEKSTTSMPSPQDRKNKLKDTEPTKYQCSACQKSYSTFSGLSKHKQFHCSQDMQKEFTCKYCDKTYVSLGALKMHIRTHTLPCKCKLCGKAFSRPWLLQGHVRTHTGEKPFTCVTCHRAFADRSNLRAHLQTHSDVKKYSCATCSKTFSRMSLLAKHEDSCGNIEV